MSLYDRSLSAVELQAIYQAGSAGKCPDPASPPELLNINFAAQGLVKEGAAAIGQGSNDFWNAYQVPFALFAGLSNLKLADGTVSTVGLTVQNGGGHTGFSHPDLMYQSACYAQDFGDITLTVTNLPGGEYDFYVYGHSAANSANSVFQLLVGGNDYGNQSTATDASWSQTSWLEGAQYVVFRGVQVTNGGAPVVVKSHPGVSGYTYLNGVQVARAMPVAPSITAQPLTQTVVVGDNVMFSVTAHGSGPLAYQWQREGTILPGATDSILSLPNVQAKDAGNYSVTITNLYGSVVSSNASLVVNPPSASCVPPPSGLLDWWAGDGSANDTLGNLDSALYGGTTIVPGKVGQAFSFDGVHNCVTNSQPGLTNVLDSYTTEFWAWPSTARSSTPEDTSGIYGHGGQRYAVFPYVGPTGGTVGSGISVGTNGVSVFEAGWGYLPALLVYDVPIVGWTHIAVVYSNRQPSLYINGVLVRSGLISVNPSCPSTWLGERGADSVDQGFYAGLLDEVSIYDRSLSTAEIRAIYQAGSAGKCPPQTPPFITSQPLNQTITVGDSASFTVRAAGTPPLSYQWRLNGTDITGATADTLNLNNAQPIDEGDYSVVVSNAFGFTTSSNAQLTVKAPIAIGLLNINFAAQGLVKEGAAAIGQGSNDFWNAYQAPFALFAGLSNLKLADGTVSTVGLTVQNGGGHTGFSHPDLMYQSACYAQDFGDITLTVTNLPGGEYDFYVYGHSAANSANSVFQLLVGGNDYGNQSTATDASWSQTSWLEGAQYVVFRGVQVTNGGAPVVVKSHPGVSGYTYLNGVQVARAMPVAPSITAQPLTQTVVVGDNVMFSVTAHGSGPLAYQWQREGTILPGATDSILSLPNVQAKDAGNYSVTITNLYGSVVSSNASLVVNPPSAKLRVVDTPAAGGSSVTVPVQIVANGNENALGFSLHFDPAILTFSKASLGDGIADAFLFANTSQMANGYVGLAIALSAGSALPAGTQTVANVTFDVAPVGSSENTGILFADQPTTRQLSDAQANVLTANYVNGTVSIAATEYRSRCLSPTRRRQIPHNYRLGSSRAVCCETGYCEWRKRVPTCRLCSPG